MAVVPMGTCWSPSQLYCEACACILATCLAADTHRCKANLVALKVCAMRGQHLHVPTCRFLLCWLRMCCSRGRHRRFSVARALMSFLGHNCIWTCCRAALMLWLCPCWCRACIRQDMCMSRRGRIKCIPDTACRPFCKCTADHSNRASCHTPNKA